jgi:hypothetical protein
MGYRSTVIADLIRNLEAYTVLATCSLGTCLDTKGKRERGDRSTAWMGYRPVIAPTTVIADLIRNLWYEDALITL